MTEGTLAARLRERLRNLVDPDKLAGTSDRGVILAYVTCSGCGARSVNDEELAAAIAQAETVEQFLDLTSLDGHSHER